MVHTVLGPIAFVVLLTVGIGLRWREHKRLDLRELLMLVGAALGAAGGVVTGLEAMAAATGVLIPDVDFTLLLFVGGFMAAVIPLWLYIELALLRRK